MSKRPISLDDFTHMSIDPETFKLFWDNQEVVTVMALPWWVQVAAVVVAFCAVGQFLLALYKAFRRKAVNESADT